MAFSKEEIEEMRRRNQRRQSRREEREKPPESSGGLVGKYIAPTVQRVLQSDPVQWWMNAPTRLGGEAVQRFGELQEAFGPEFGGPPPPGDPGSTEILGLNASMTAPNMARAYGGMLGHGLREFGSDVLDIASDVSRGLIPETWGEQLDPSSSTELGAQVEAEKDRFRKEQGRNPSMIEEYDIMVGIQDAKFPWLTERHKVGPVEFSNRMLIELPTEAAVVAGEIAFTGGTAALSRQAAKLGVKSTVKVTAAQAAKQKAIRSASVAAEQALLIPKRIDDLLGAVITKPLKLGVFVAGVPVKITKKVFVRSINQFRRKAQEQGMPMDQVNAKAKEAWNQAVNEGHIEDVPPNTQLRFSDFFDEDIDAPKVVPEREATDFQTHQIVTSHDNVMGIPDPPPISPRTGASSVMERISDTVKAVSKPMDDALFRINEKMHNAASWIPLRVRREGLTLAETNEKRLAGDLKTANKTFNNEAANRMEAAAEGVGSRINFAISYLAKTWPGLIRNNVGGAGSKTKARFDLDVDAMAARGELIGDLLASGGDEYNIIVSDGWFKAQGINQTVTGNTLISHATKQKMSAWVVTPEGDNWIAVNLEPGFADVAERLDKYEEALRAVTHEVTEPVSIAGRHYNKGDTINAYDIIESVSDEVVAYEDQLIRDGVSGAGQAVGVTRRYFPHNVIAGEITESGKLPANGVQEIDLNVNPDIPGNYWGSHNIKKREFRSQAEGMLNNRVYVHPAQAAASQVKYVGEHIRNKKLGKWINQVAAENHMKYGTVKDLMGKSAAGRALLDAQTKIRYALQLVRNRQMRARMATQPHLIGKASEMLGRRVDLETGQIISEAGEVITGDQQLGFGLLDLELPYNLMLGRPKLGSKTPQFENNLDKVLYIIRSKASASAGEPGYFEWLESLFPGVSRQQFREAAESVRSAVVKSGRNVAEGNDFDVPTSVTEGNVSMADELTRMSREALGEDDIDTLMADMETSLEFQPKISADNTGGDAMEAELKRLREDITKWGKNVDSLVAKDLLRDQEEKAIRAQIKVLDASYEKLKKEVMQDMGQITGFHLEGHYFPRVFAEAIRDGLQEDVKRTKEPSSVLKSAMWVNSFLRTMGATADLSGMGIQGWTAVMDDVYDLPLKQLKKLKRDTNGQVSMKVHRIGPGFSAFKDMWRALGTNGDAVVGEFFYHAEIMAKQHGLPTPTQAAQDGLAILAHAPDLFEAGRGIPFIKNFDRAFTHYGNILRYDLYIQEIEEAMLKTGLPAQQLIDEGYGKEVAGVLNVMTGVGRRGFGGNSMQFMVFAPRFAHARLSFSFDSSKGMVKGPLGRASIRQRIASRRLSKFIGSATMLTFMINEAQGEETDINPFIRNPQTGEWHWNSNFMRVHVGQLDISLFSSFDSFMRLLATVPLLALNRMNGVDVKGIQDQVQGLISAPATSVVTDLVLGHDAMGRKTRNDFGDLNALNVTWDVMNELLDHTIPFAWNEFFRADTGQQSIVQRVFEGVDTFLFDPIEYGSIGQGVGEVVSAALQTGLQILGSKSAYESISETKNAVYAEVLNLGPANVELQEAFGMTEQELRDYLGNKGRGVLNDNKGFDFSVSFRNLFPFWSNKTPDWTQIAGDYQQNIKKKLDAGVFQSIMSAEEAKQVEANIQARVEASAEPYSRYRVARDDIDDAEQEMLQNDVDTFLAEGRLDFNTFLAELRGTRKVHGGARRNLLEGDNAPFKGLKEDLFDFGRTSALGNLSSADSDVYDYAQAYYYDQLYGDDSVVDSKGNVDWDKRDEKMAEWATNMEERYPHLSSAEVLQYRLRIENSARKDAPPLAQQLFEISRMISDSKYYDLGKQVAMEMAPYAGHKDAAENMRLYKEWDKLSYAGQEAFIAEDIRDRNWLINVRGERIALTAEYFFENPDIESLLQVTNNSRNPISGRAGTVHDIINDHQHGNRRLSPDEIIQFLDDVITNKPLTKYL